MHTVLEQTNLAVRLVLELLMLILVAAAAWRAPGATVSRAARAACAAVAGVAVAVCWAFIVHSGLPWPVRLSVEVAFFALAAWSLASRRGKTAGGVFVAAVLGNAALMAVWHQ